MPLPPCSRVHVRLIAEAAPSASEDELRELLGAAPSLLRGSLDLRLALAGQLPVLAASLVRAATAPPDADAPTAVSAALLGALDAVGDTALALVLDDSEGVRRAGVDCVVAAAWEMVSAAAVRLESSGAAPAPCSLAAPLVARDCSAAFARLLGVLVHMLSSVASHPNDRYSSSSPRLAAGLLSLCIGAEAGQAPPPGVAATAAVEPGSSASTAAAAAPPPLAPRAAFDALIAHLAKQSSSESELVRLACADALAGWAAALSADAALSLAVGRTELQAGGPSSAHVATLVSCTLALLRDPDNSVRESATRAFAAVSAAASQLQLLLGLVPAYHALLMDSSDRVSIAAGTHLGALVAFVAPAADARLLAGHHAHRGGGGGRGVDAAGTAPPRASAADDSSLHRLLHVWLLLASGRLKGERTVEHRGAPPPPPAFPLRRLPPLLAPSDQPPPSPDVAVASLSANRGDGLFTTPPAMTLGDANVAGTAGRGSSNGTLAASPAAAAGAAGAPSQDALADTVLEGVASPLSLLRLGSRLSLVPSPSGGAPPLHAAIARYASTGGFAVGAKAAAGPHAPPVAASLSSETTLLDSARSLAAAYDLNAGDDGNSDDGYSSSGSGAEVLSVGSDDAREAADDEDEEGDGWGGGFTASGALSDVRVRRSRARSGLSLSVRSTRPLPFLPSHHPLQRRRVVLAARALPAIAFTAVRLAHCTRPPPPFTEGAARTASGTRTPAGALHAAAVRAASRAWHETILRLRVTLQGLLRCVAYRDANGRATATLLAAYPALLAGLGAAYASLDAASSVWAATATQAAEAADAWASRAKAGKGGASASAGSSGGGTPSGSGYSVPGDVSAATVLGVVLDHLIACLRQHRASGAALDTRHAALTAAAGVIGCFSFRQQMRLLRAILAASGIHARPQAELQASSMMGRVRGGFHAQPQAELQASQASQRWLGVFRGIEVRG